MGDVFSALAHPVRREILRLLRGRAMSAGELADRFDLAKPTMSGHFTVLKHAGLVAVSRKGTTLVYRLNVSVVEEALAALLEIAGTGKKEPRPWAASARR
jgi:ArsR family transcriptional regulator, arsenate/arsenite/antimonite-responsive transcriptional repressor